MMKELPEMLQWSECVVLAQQPGAEAAALIVGSGKPVLDLVRARIQ